MTMSWAVLLFLCSWWRWCRGSRLWSLFPFFCCFCVTSSPCFFRFLSSLHSHSTSHFKLLCILSFLSLCSLFSCSNFSPSPRLPVLALGVFIGQKGAGASLLPPYGSAWGAGLCCPATAPGWLANERGWQGAAPSVYHHERVWGFGRWQACGV